MKEQIAQVIATAIEELVAAGTIAGEYTGTIQVTRAKDSAHGDYSSNIALIFAKQAKQPPRELAQALCNSLSKLAQFEQVEVAGPGFINFFIAQKNQTQVIEKILAEGLQYGINSRGKDASIHIEYVSANPTGPLHVGHGRGAAYGATLANLYDANGYRVHREYYVNDAGRQMDILATSVWLRYLDLCGAEFPLPQ